VAEGGPAGWRPSLAATPAETTDPHRRRSRRISAFSPPPSQLPGLGRSVRARWGLGKPQPSAVSPTAHSGCCPPPKAARAPRSLGVSSAPVLRGQKGPFRRDVEHPGSRNPGSLVAKTAPTIVRPRASLNGGKDVGRKKIAETVPPVVEVRRRGSPHLNGSRIPRGFGRQERLRSLGGAPHVGIIPTPVAGGVEGTLVQPTRTCGRRISKTKRSGGSAWAIALALISGRRLSTIRTSAPVLRLRTRWRPVLNRQMPRVVCPVGQGNVLGVQTRPTTSSASRSCSGQLGAGVCAKRAVRRCLGELSTAVRWWAER